jgi:lipoate-protein ligase B
MQRVIDWGITDYRDACSRQLDLVHQIRNGQSAETLVLTEHQPVYTLGARKGAIDNLLVSEEDLQADGVAVIQSNRGGDITYHGPGQLVGYPILRLDQRGKDLHAYLRALENVLIQTLQHFNIVAGRRSGLTGIWIEDRKIAAIGVAVKAWTTYHGFSLNINPDLEAFSKIIPCGIREGQVTSMENESPPAPLMGMVKARLSLEFWKQFENLR